MDLQPRDHLQDDTVAISQQLSSSSGPSQASLPELIAPGARISIGGQPYRVTVIGGEDTALEPTPALPRAERQALETSLEVLRQAAQTVQRMSDRLLDPADGMTLRGAALMAENLPCLPAGAADALAPYLLAITKFGGTLHPTRGSVVPPPLPRAELEQAVAGLPALQTSGFDVRAWMDTIYDPVPRVTEGHYLFSSPADRQRFDALLGSEHTILEAQVREIFERGTRSQLTPNDIRDIDRASQKMMELQKAALEPALAADADARAMSTRVRISVSDTGQITLASTHLTDEFKQDLTQLRGQLLAAASALPAVAQELKEVLSAQADWCVDTARGHDWGQSLPRWVAAKDPASVIDVNMTCEEKASHLGAKSNFHILVTQHVEVPDALKDVWKAVQESASRSNVNTLLLKTLLVGGHASNYTISGEKLPDPANQPEYKSMTFKNTTEAMMLTAQADAISASTGLSAADIAAMKSIPVLAVALHEYGHTLGDHASFLGVHAGSVEETNAQSSAVYLTAKLAPESVGDILNLEACWMPVRRVRQGPTEQHSRSDIVLFEEYLNQGAIGIVDKNGKQVVSVLDPARAVEVAYGMAIKMRLWEKGIPERLHAGLKESFAAADPDQDSRIIKRALAFVGAQPDQAALRAETLAEVNAYFANQRLLDIGDKLTPVIAHMPGEQPLAIVPTDERYGLLVKLP